MNAVIRSHERNETRAAVDVFSNERADGGGVITDRGDSQLRNNRLVTAKHDRE